MKKKPLTSASYTLKKTPYLITVLDISTGHITKKDNGLLLKSARANDLLYESNDSMIVYEYKEGFYVYIQEKAYNESLRNYGYSKELLRILDRARQLKCKYVQFDADGITYADLKTFNW